MAATTQQPAAASADVEEYQQHIDSVFSLKRPRDIRAGLSSGAKSAAKGIALGTAGLFAAPIFGAYTDGVKGFAQGVGAGEVLAIHPVHVYKSISQVTINAAVMLLALDHVLHISRYAGVAGAVLLPVAGLGVGVTQIVRGAVNTPEAVRELNKGRFWDQVSSSSGGSSSKTLAAAL